MSINCLILGENGFIGSHLVKMMVEFKNINVRIFGRQNVTFNGEIYRNIDYRVGDFSDT